VGQLDSAAILWVKLGEMLLLLVQLPLSQGVPVLMQATTCHHIFTASTTTLLMLLHVN